MAKHGLIGYKAGQGFLYQLSGASKFLFFILVSIASMTTYDTRLIAFIAIGSLLLFHLSGIQWQDVSAAVTFVALFAVLNLMTVYLFAPHYGDDIYGATTLILDGPGAYDLTQQELFYLFNLFLKYCCTVPMALLFLLTTHPSQFAASLNQIGVSYKIAYAVSLTLRYIPDIQEDFAVIKLSQEARGLELSRKGNIIRRIKGNVQLITPLIFTSLERIDMIATAMELRRFGKDNKRTWYYGQTFNLKDYLVILFGILVLLATFGLFYTNQGRFYNPWQ